MSTLCLRIFSFDLWSKPNHLFNRDLNRGCLVYMFSLHFSGSKFLTNLRRQFCVRKFFSCTWNFSYINFCGIRSLFNLSLKLLFRKCITYVLGCSFIKTCSLTRLLASVFVLVNAIVFNRPYGLMIKFLIACLMN